MNPFIYHRDIQMEWLHSALITVIQRFRKKIIAAGSADGMAPVSGRAGATFALAQI